MAQWETDATAKLGGRIRNLVFEGGGVWGIAYEGVLAELERLGIVAGVRRVGGASAGAITATLLATGHTATDLGRVLRETNFKDFTDDSLGFARDTARLLTEYGWYKGDAFRTWIRERIREGTDRISGDVGVPPPPARPTFRQLRAWQQRVERRGRALPELYLIGSNLTRQRREVYSAERGHSPDVRVEDAVRASMSIPLFFACARGDRRDVLVDGGLTWNYPVNLFDDRRYVVDPACAREVAYATSSNHVFNAETLGFRLDTTGELQANLRDWHNQPVKIDNIVRYGWALVSFIRAVANKLHLHKNDWSRTIFVDVGEDIAFTKFDLTDAEIEFLADRGREGVRSYLRWRVSKTGEREIERIYRDCAPRGA